MSACAVVNPPLLRRSTFWKSVNSARWGTLDDGKKEFNETDKGWWSCASVDIHESMRTCCSVERLQAGSNADYKNRDTTAPGYCENSTSFEAVEK